MSDETPPPALRLKPRLRPDTPAQVAPGETHAAAGDAPSPAAPVEVSPDLQQPAATAKPEPKADVPAPADETLDVGRLKLRPRTAADPVAPPPGANLPAPAIAPAIPAAPKLPPISLPIVPLKEAAPPPSLPPEMSPPPLPAVPASALPKAGALPPLAPSAGKPPPFVKSTAPAGAAPGKSSDAPENSPAFRAGVWAIGAVLVLGLGGIGFLGYRFLTQRSEPAPSAEAARAQPAAQPAAQPVAAAPAAEEPHSGAAKQLAKAKAVVAEREQSGQVAGVNEVVGAPTGTPAESAAAPAVSASAKTAPEAGEEVAPIPVEKPEPIILTPPKPPPSQGFRVYVVNLKVSGVLPGEPGRAILNGRMFRVGEIVEPHLGIRLVGIEADKKTLFFEDLNGAEMSRRF